MTALDLIKCLTDQITDIAGTIEYSIVPVYLRTYLKKCKYHVPRYLLMLYGLFWSFLQDGLFIWLLFLLQLLLQHQVLKKQRILYVQEVLVHFV